jgi:hypothetical protein
MASVLSQITEGFVIFPPSPNISSVQFVSSLLILHQFTTTTGAAANKAANDDLLEDDVTRWN